jgi:hypothetical protein
MIYVAKYKLKGQLFWRTVKNVIGDHTISELGLRCFVLNDETRVEIPYVGTSFKFSKERFMVIKKNMEKESGQVLPMVR